MQILLFHLLCTRGSISERDKILVHELKKIFRLKKKKNKCLVKILISSFTLLS